MSGILLLVTGRANSGKDTLANRLKEILGDRCVTFALADKLKELIVKLFPVFGKEPINISDLNNRDTKEQYRYYMQQIGTECCRGIFGDDFWCKQLHNDIYKRLISGHIVIITDIRFINEYKYFTESFKDIAKNIITVHVDRTNPTASTHRSEAEYYAIPSTHVIRNYNTFDDYITKINNFADIIKGYL